MTPNRCELQICSDPSSNHCDCNYILLEHSLHCIDWHSSPLHIPTVANYAITPLFNRDTVGDKRLKECSFSALSLSPVQDKKFEEKCHLLWVVD